MKEAIQQIRLGIVGLGRGLGAVMDTLQDSDVRLVALCDNDPEMIESAKKKLAQCEDVDYADQIEYYLDFEQMLKADINAVFVATYAVDHVSFVLRALDAGKHVLSEIPTVNSLEEAKTLKKAVAAHPELKYMCAENCCYFGHIQAWKKMYEDGKFGEVVYAEGEYLHAKDFRTYKTGDYKDGHWRTYNPCIKYCTHELGPLLYIMDDKPVSVTCMVPDARYNPFKEAAYVENAVMLVKTQKGAVLRIWISFGAYVGFMHSYALYGTRGMIEADKSQPLNDAHCKARFSDVPGSFDDQKIDVPITATSFQDGRGKSHLGIDRKMMRDFYDCVKNDTEPPIGVDLGIRMSLAGIYAHQSYLNGGTAVEIPDPDSFED